MRAVVTSFYANYVMSRGHYFQLLLYVNTYPQFFNGCKLINLNFIKKEEKQNPQNPQNTIILYLVKKNITVENIDEALSNNKNI